MDGGRFCVRFDFRYRQPLNESTFGTTLKFQFGIYIFQINVCVYVEASVRKKKIEKFDYIVNWIKTWSVLFFRERKKYWPTTERKKRNYFTHLWIIIRSCLCSSKTTSSFFSQSLKLFVLTFIFWNLLRLFFFLLSLCGTPDWHLLDFCPILFA